MATSKDQAQVRRTLLLSGVHVPEFVGTGEKLLLELEQAYPQVFIHLRDHVLTLSGPAFQVAQVEKTVLALLEKARKAQHAKTGNKTGAHNLEQISLDLATDREPILAFRSRQIGPQTAGQREYVTALAEKQVVFCTGPAGSGKTFLAIAMAVRALQKQQVSKIVLTRPAVEAGEHLGYLPGSLEEKIDPYLRPLFDALSNMLPAETVTKLLESGAIEVAPLAYMRGRTLNEAFVILDEAQNATGEQMKMFLTRLGYDSRMVITGDLTQTDLPHKRSGLLEALKVLAPVSDIGFVELASEDIVRNELVGKIVAAYAQGAADAS